MNFLCGWARSTQQKQENQFFRGTPDEVLVRIDKDIQAISKKLNNYHRSTGADSSLLNKMHVLLKADQRARLARLKTEHLSDPDSRAYKQELVELKKTIVDELCSLWDLVHSGKMKRSLEVAFSHKPVGATSASDSSDDTDDAPDCLLDPILFNILQDPVVSPSGITYEKAPLLNYIQRHGHHDPITRDMLHPNELYPNLAIRDAAIEYLQAKSII